MQEISEGGTCLVSCLITYSIIICLVSCLITYSIIHMYDNNKRIIIISEATYHISCVQIVN